MIRREVEAIAKENDGFVITVRHWEPKEYLDTVIVSSELIFLLFIAVISLEVIGLYSFGMIDHEKLASYHQSLMSFIELKLKSEPFVVYGIIFCAVIALLAIIVTAIRWFGKGKLTYDQIVKKCLSMKLNSIGGTEVSVEEMKVSAEF
jgi:hypothetical protein